MITIAPRAGAGTIRVLGTGSHLPAQVVTNADVGEPAGVTDEWIVRKTGIRNRRWAKPYEATSDLAVMAGRAALDDAASARRTCRWWSWPRRRRTPRSRPPRASSRTSSVPGRAPRRST